MPGARAPVLVTEAMVARMKDGAVIVDVAVDQGGCVETIRPTTLVEPVYRLAGVVHYGVANMPALVPRTSTFALTNATLPYAVELATRGVREPSAPTPSWPAASTSGAAASSTPRSPPRSASAGAARGSTGVSLA